VGRNAHELVQPIDDAEGVVYGDDLVVKSGDVSLKDNGLRKIELTIAFEDPTVQVVLVNRHAAGENEVPFCVVGFAGGGLEEFCFSEVREK